MIPIKDRERKPIWNLPNGTRFMLSAKPPLCRCNIFVIDHKGESFSASYRLGDPEKRMVIHSLYREVIDVSDHYDVNGVLLACHVIRPKV